jgi:hypothetical protein
MNLRSSADQASWSIREAAWGVEERVFWRGSDAAQAAADRAVRATFPLQRLIQTKLVWPLADAYRARGKKTRAAIAASAATLAVAAGAAGAIKAGDHAASSPAVAPLAPLAAGAPQASDTLVLKGVTPQFQPADAADAPAPPAPAPKPTEKPAQVAWDFAQTFVVYEVGHSSKKTAVAFGDTATKQLAKALKADPPRLPASGKVPRARVLNVVLGTASKNQVTASVSLARLRAASELRLTLTREGAQWRVAQVLG